VNPELARLRRLIDEIDSRILALLNERVARALEIGVIKSGEGRSVRDPGRERLIVTRMQDAAEGPLGRRAVGRIFQLIVEETRRAERRLNGGGDEGSD
jgi:chorismate mutase/prephenate dehydratase